MKGKRAALLVIFTTVLLDLIGFGIVIPLVSLYGRHFGAGALELALLGAIYSLMQFLFAPFWGNLSDTWGRRPILLVSLAGSTLSYVVFAFAPHYSWLILSRAFAGLFGANISAAQAYIADITPPEERARGMGLIGAAFGIGFTLGPPLGGFAAAKFGLAAPGLIAAFLCGANLLLAFFRLPESLRPDLRKKATRRNYSPLNMDAVRLTLQHPLLWLAISMFFIQTFAFANMEQTLTLLLQTRLSLPTEAAGLKSGFLLMWAGILSASIQGGMIRPITRRFGEYKTLLAGLGLNALGLLAIGFAPSYWVFFLCVVPMTGGTALLSPSLMAMISRSAPAYEQGAVLGLTQGLASLARAIGPFCGMLLFVSWTPAPFLLASALSLSMFLLAAGSAARFRGVRP